MWIEQWKSKIQHALQQPLPGLAAHLKLAPSAKRFDFTIPSDAIHAAVLIVLYQKDEELYFPLITRQSDHEADHHRGQVSLPGGRKDASDESLQKTAIRECSEEIGLPQHKLEILGELSPLYIPVSKHWVHPYLASYSEPPKFTLQTREVFALHEISITALLTTENIKRQTIQTSDLQLREVPAFCFNELVVWGATSMILAECAEVMRTAGLNP